MSGPGGAPAPRAPRGERPRATFAMRPASLPGQLFAPATLERLRGLVDLDPELVLTEYDSDRAREALAGTEILLAGWGAPPLTPAHRAPRLRAVVYAGGVAATCLSDPAAFAARGLAAANAREANALPVAEYTLAMILLANKQSFLAERLHRERRGPLDRERELTDAGNYRRTVGIVGASSVGRALIRLLRPFDLDVLLYAPEVTEESAAALGVRAASLERLMRESDVVTLHQPLTPQTAGQIDAGLLALLRDGATLINTARGGVLDHEALLHELRTGRISAVLDVTDPEPLPPGSEFWDLPNVRLTPHIAGSMGRELHRLGAQVAAEVARFVAGEPFAHPEVLA
ncbi:hydroxyacid dehydrogenase [Streptomyces hoynatensis]|uniref:Hydroxyacid dehydrogenase n=1 Tax=Streptomyces hoynatensis TaxID=1141874 RepID=A0A3A9Z6C1_9ACTN|nr:hydroxyacid dehydrogenase [Streptomyces hoynatensis]RKN43921.1 hydroxyacid dehydrogenase [Streptomyces hoynatensis]